MKTLTVLTSLALILAIFPGCGKENSGQNDINVTTTVFPITLENGMELARFFVSSMSLSQKMLQQADAVDTAVANTTTTDTCPMDGRIGYTFTSGSYPVTVTFDRCADERSTMNGTLRFDSSGGTRSIEFTGDMNISHGGKETVIHSGTTLNVSVSANNSANQDIYLSIDMDNNGTRAKSTDMIFVNLYQDGKNYALYNGNISFDQNKTFTYNISVCGDSGTVCVSPPAQVYTLENGLLTAGEGSPLYFRDESDNRANISLEERNRLQIRIFDTESGSNESQEVNISGTIF